MLVSNAAAFASRYGAGKPVAGVYANTLSDTGERLLLVNSAGGTILDFSYHDNGSWPTEADGVGYTLALIRPGLDPNDPSS